jgi:hypothetical protein
LPLKLLNEPLLLDGWKWMSNAVNFWGNPTAKVILPLKVKKELMEDMQFAKQKYYIMIDEDKL